MTRASGNGHGPALAVVKPPPAEPGRTPPPDADATTWTHATTASGTWGRDGTQTYQLTGERNGSPQWGLMLDGIVRFGTDRTAAPDPDFPDRADEADPEGRNSPEGLTDFTVRMMRDGKLREKTVRRMPASQAREMAMLDAAGTSAWLGASTSRAGRQRLFEASLALSETEGRSYDVFYQVTGHYVLPGGERVFVGGTRVVRADGSSADLAVATDDRLEAWSFPVPLTAAEMTGGLEEVAALLDGADPRVIVPQLATAWRALFGVYRNPADPGAEHEVSPSSWLTGVTGSGKSGTTAAAVNCAGAPGLRYNTLPFKAGPSKFGGISGPALERVLFKTRDLCIPFDDLDPAVPAAEGRAWQSDFLRRLADQKSRAVAEGRDGLRNAKPPRCLSIASGEPMDGEDSGVNRAMNLPFDRDTVRLGSLRTLTRADRRNIRAQFGTSVLCAILADYHGARAMLADRREARRAMFLEGRGESGPVLRGADVAAEMTATLDAVITLAVRRGADPDKAAGLLARFETAMADAWERHLEIIGKSGRSRSFIDLISDALSMGAAHLDDADAPGTPPAGGAAVAVGWRPGSGPMLAPQGPMIGWRDPDGSWWLSPTPATAAAKTLAERAGEGWSGTAATVGQTLKADGLLISAESGRPNGAAVRLPRKLRELGLGVRAWHVDPRAADTGDDDGQAPGGTDPAPPVPEPPADVDGQGDADPWAAEQAAMDAYHQAEAELTTPAPAATEYARTAPAVSGPSEQAPPPTSSPPTSSPAPSSPASSGRDTWMAETRQRVKWTREQWAAFDHMTRLLDTGLPDLPPGTDPTGDDVAGLANSLRMLAAFEDQQKDETHRGRRAPFAPYQTGCCGREREHSPWWQAPLPVIAADLIIDDMGMWERPYKGRRTVLDCNAAWPTALSTVEVAHGGYEHTGRLDLDTGKVRPGYYVVESYPWREPGLPNPLGRDVKPGQKVGITAPRMRLLVELASRGRWPDPSALDSWTGDPVRLTGFAQLVRELRRYAIEMHGGRDGYRYDAVKTEFGKAMSLILGALDLGESGKMVRRWKCYCRRTDWRHHLQEQHSVMMWRRADDCLALAGPELGPVSIRARDELVVPAAALDAVTSASAPGGWFRRKPPVVIDETTIRYGTFKIKGEE